jgi:hypothetical protein
MNPRTFKIRDAIRIGRSNECSPCFLTAFIIILLPIHNFIFPFLITTSCKDVTTTYIEKLL